MKWFTIIVILIFFFIPKGFSQQQANLVLPMGHTDWVSSAQFSPKGKLIVTISADNTAKVWDTQTGKLLYDLLGHTDWLGSAQFSPKGRFIVTASGDKTAKIWEVATGKLLYDLKGHTDMVRTAQFSPGGKLIVTASGDKTAKIWEVATGKLLYDLKGHTDWVSSAQFSPRGKLIVTASGDKTAKIWEVATGKLLHDLKGHEGWVGSAQFSSEGKLIVTASGDKTAKIWEVATGKLLYDLKGHEDWVGSAQFSLDENLIVTISGDRTAKIWDSQTGELLHNLREDIEILNSAHFSPNGDMIVAAYSGGMAKVWDVATGKHLYMLKDHVDNVTSAQYSPDGNLIVTTSEDQTAKIWNVKSGKLLHDLEGFDEPIEKAHLCHKGKRVLTKLYNSNLAIIWDIVTGNFLQNLKGLKDKVYSIQFSLDGNRIVTASGDHTAKIWHSQTGKLLHILNGHSGVVESAQFSPDGKLIVTASWDETAKIWDVATGKRLHDLQGHTEWVNSAHFSPDGKAIVTVSRDNTVKIWKTIIGKMLHNLRGHTKFISSIYFSPDGKQIVTSSYDGTAKIWGVASGKLLQNIDGHEDYVYTAKFSPDGKKIVTASEDATAKIWDVKTGKLLHVLNGHSRAVRSAQFSPDGEKVLTIAYQDKTAKIWDVSTGKMLHNLIGHARAIETAQYSPSGRYVISIGYDHKTIIWNAETGEMLYTRLHLKGGDWLVYDKHYRYDGSEGARDYLYFTCGLEVIELDQMKDALYVPGLVEKIMNGRDINYPKLSDLDICGALPLVEPLDENEKDYEYKITPRKYGLEGVEVYVNDKKVLYYPASELTRKGEAYNLRISQETLSQHFISGQENTVNVQAVATQKGREIRSRGMATLQYYEEPEMAEGPKLFAVMVGVNDYKHDELDLNYPAKDATNLSDALKLSAGKLLGDENVFIYEIHSETTADEGFTTPEKEGIRKALEDIGAKANPQDVILIFFAGHGVMQGDEEKIFTFLTAEASEINPVGITTRELQNWLSYEGPHKMRANKSIMIFDACHSGKASEELISMARDDDETQRIRQVEDLKDKSGMFILAASAPNQSAYELPQYEQGLLTYSLLHTMKNNPEVLDEGKYLNVQKWFLESEEYLQELVRKMGYQQDAQPYGTANIRIGEVNEEVKNSIALAKEKPVLFCANVLNGATFSDDLKLKAKVNNHLDEVTKRGSESDFVYSRVESPKANLINIIYQTDGNKVTCQVKLIKGEEQLFQKTISGSKAELDQLVNEIIEEVAGFAE